MPPTGVPAAIVMKDSNEIVSPMPITLLPVEDETNECSNRAVARAEGASEMIATETISVRNECAVDRSRKRRNTGNASLRFTRGKWARMLRGVTKFREVEGFRESVGQPPT